MCDKKKYIFIVVALVFLMLLLVGARKAPVNNVVNNKEESEKLSNQIPEEQAKIEKVNVSGYHLVTYDQSANTNSFIKSLSVNANTASTINFVIGTIDEEKFIEERTSFELKCIEGENEFELVDQRIFLRTGEYLFMDIMGQDVLYVQKGKHKHTLVQHESNRLYGKMFFTESDFILPFSYTLEKVQEYNCLAIGNNITTTDGGTGSAATDAEKDYYFLTKSRLGNTFDKVNMNRINAIDWETNKVVGTRKQWIDKNLKKETLTGLDLVIFQLGDNYTEVGKFEASATELVEHVRQYSPNAQILWVGLWEINQQLLNMLPGMCERLEIEFVNISDLAKPAYQSLVNQPLENNNYNQFQQVNQAFYPNNEAMQIISNRIIETLKFEF